FIGLLHHRPDHHAKLAEKSIEDRESAKAGWLFIIPSGNPLLSPRRLPSLMPCKSALKMGDTHSSNPNGKGTKQDIT
ncbi:hypothetical protein, partial [Limosilactobacillus fermentum]|uniref:hypothetical protein n=1 Tax=Limosilactobacillus fermentum TaxID=1613 RepID=UPI001C9E13C1